MHNPFDSAAASPELRAEAAALAHGSLGLRASGAMRARLHALLSRYGETGVAEAVEPAGGDLVSRLERLHRIDRLAAEPLARVRRGYAVTAIAPVGILLVGLLAESGGQIEGAALVVGAVAFWDLVTAPVRNAALRLRRQRRKAARRIRRLVEEAAALGRERLYAVGPVGGGAVVDVAIAYRDMKSVHWDPQERAVSIRGHDGREILRLAAADRDTFDEIALRIDEARGAHERVA